jgi:hypothetical protein
MLSYTNAVRARHLDFAVFTYEQAKINLAKFQ